MQRLNSRCTEICSNCAVCITIMPLCCLRVPSSLKMLSVLARLLPNSLCLLYLVVSPLLLGEISRVRRLIRHLFFRRHVLEESVTLGYIAQTISGFRTKMGSFGPPASQSNLKEERAPFTL